MPRGDGQGWPALPGASGGAGPAAVPPRRHPNKSQLFLRLPRCSTSPLLINHPHVTLSTSLLSRPCIPPPPLPHNITFDSSASAGFAARTQHGTTHTHTVVAYRTALQQQDSAGGAQDDVVYHGDRCSQGLLQKQRMSRDCWEGSPAWGRQETSRLVPPRGQHRLARACLTLLVPGCGCFSLAALLPGRRMPEGK